MAWIQTSNSFRAYATCAKLAFIVAVATSYHQFFWVAATLAVLVSASAESVIYRLRSLALEIDQIGRAESYLVRYALRDLSRYPAGSLMMDAADWPDRYEVDALRKIDHDWRVKETRRRMTSGGLFVDITDFWGVFIGDACIVGIAYLIAKFVL
jgi:hypothetical protein